MSNLLDIGGITLIANPILVETVEITDRVRGGYMNRWWVLKTWTVTRPANHVIRCGDRVYCHPDIFEAVKAQVEKENRRLLINAVHMLDQQRRHLRGIF